MSQESIFPVLIHFSSIAAVSFLSSASFRRLRIAKVRGSVFAEREAALLQDYIGAVFVGASLPRGDPLDYEGSSADIYTDEIGGGRGVADRLRELNYSVKPFNASKRPTTEQRQFTYANLRAEAYARMATR